MLMPPLLLPSKVFERTLHRDPLPQRSPRSNIRILASLLPYESYELFLLSTSLPSEPEKTTPLLLYYSNGSNMGDPVGISSPTVVEKLCDLTKHCLLVYVSFEFSVVPSPLAQ